MSNAVPQLLQLGSQVGALMSGLAIAIQRLAEHEGGSDGPWLDRIESEMVAEVKGATFSDGLAMEFELAMQSAQIEIIRQAVAFARSKLAKPSEQNP